jgi:nucleoside-diphosphate-sugar epimerase
MVASERSIGESINLASAREIQIIDLAKSINVLTGNQAGVAFKERREWDKKNRLLASIDKARKTIGYEPSTEFAHGLGLTYKWFQTNWKNIEKSAEFV